MAKAAPALKAKAVAVTIVKEAAPLSPVNGRLKAHAPAGLAQAGVVRKKAEAVAAAFKAASSSGSGAFKASGGTAMLRQHAQVERKAERKTEDKKVEAKQSAEKDTGGWGGGYNGFLSGFIN